jgi:hypothetical protein
MTDTTIRPAALASQSAWTSRQKRADYFRS